MKSDDLAVIEAAKASAIASLERAAKPEREIAAGREANRQAIERALAPRTVKP